VAFRIKPGPGMEEMKFDMCGAGTVLGVFQAVVKLGLPINLI
jgi:leucyl aminopeptidase